MLIATDISLGFDDRNILNHVSVKVGPGDRIALIGPSGSGKTTLLNALVGILKPKSGRVALDDKDIWHICDPLKRRPTSVPDIWPYVTIVFQELNLFPNLSARDNCLIGISPNDTPRAERELLILAACLQVENCLLRKPRQMSHGQRQRFAILRAAVRRPRYLLLDEPTSSLDPDSRKRLSDMLADNALFHGTAIITATHDLHFAHDVANVFWSIADDRLIISNSFSNAISIYEQ